MYMRHAYTLVRGFVELHQICHQICFFIIDELEIAVGHFQLVHFYHGALLYILYSSSERTKKTLNYSSMKVICTKIQCNARSESLIIISSQ